MAQKDWDIKETGGIGQHQCKEAIQKGPMWYFAERYSRLGNLKVSKCLCWKIFLSFKMRFCLKRSDTDRCEVD